MRWWWRLSPILLEGYHCCLWQRRGIFFIQWLCTCILFLIRDAYLFSKNKKKYIKKNTWNFYLIVKYDMCWKMQKISWRSRNCESVSSNRNRMKSCSWKEKLHKLLFFIATSLCNEYKEKWIYRSLCSRSSNY